MSSIRESKVDLLSTKDLDMRGRKCVNAGNAQAAQDYVTLSQLNDAIAAIPSYQLPPTQWFTIGTLLVNGWTDAGSSTDYGLARVGIDPLGIKHVRAYLLAGTKADGTIILTLPRACWPQHFEVFPIQIFNGTTGGLGKILIRSDDGTIRLYDLSGVATLNIHLNIDFY